MARRSMGSSRGGGSRSSFSSSSSRSSFGSGISRSSRNSRTHTRSLSTRPYIRSSIHVDGNFNPSLSKIISIVVACIFAFVGITFVVAGSAQISHTNQLISIKRSDYNYYQNMISFAEKNPDYLATGQVTEVYFDYQVNEHYFEYTVCGYNFSTFACYNSASIPLKGQHISVALNLPKELFNSSSDSMPVSYKNTTLEDDGEYNILCEDRNAGIFFVVFGLAFAVLTVVTIFKTRKKPTSSVEETSTNNTTASPSKNFCAYCGAENSPEARKCSSCGARIE